VKLFVDFLVSGTHKLKMQDNESIIFQLPAEITQGDVADFRISIPQFSPNAGFLHNFTLIGDSARFAVSQAVQVSITDKISIPIPASVTQNLPAGELTYQFRAHKEGKTALALTGSVTILENLEMAENTDTRDNFQKIIDAIDAALAGSTKITVLEYEIAGRKIRNIMPSELIQLRNYYQCKVNQQQSSEFGSRGTQHLVRFVRS